MLLPSVAPVNVVKNTTASCRIFVSYRRRIRWPTALSSSITMAVKDRGIFEHLFLNEI